MRRLLMIALLAQSACWSEQVFTEKCVAAGHCVVDGDDAGPVGDDGGAIDDGGTPDSGTPDSGTPDSGTPDSGTPDSGTPDSGTSDGGALTWAEVVGELFPQAGGDGGFTLEFKPAGVNGKWVGAVLTNTGDVICVPAGNSQALRITPARVITTIGSTLGPEWGGGVLLNDGGVLGLPYDANSFVAISSSTVLVVDAGLPRPGSAIGPYFQGGVITLSQQVLLAPRNDYSPGVYDPASKTLTLLDGGSPTFIFTEAYYQNAILQADGESALMIPRNARQLMHVTPTARSIVGPQGIEGHAGGLLLPDGSVLMLPVSSSMFMRWDGLSATDQGPIRAGYFSAAWSTNGFGYALQTGGQADESAIAVIDRDGVVNEVPLVDAGVFSDSHYGLVSFANGTIVGCPYASDDVLFIVPNAPRTVSLRTMTSPWLNKW